MTDRRTGTAALPPGLEDAELVAHGGFASVYRAWQTDFNRDVAVKVLAADATDPDVRTRFEREVRAMGSLSHHPHVVPVYDAGIHDDRPYLVMPYLSGGSLARELGRGPLPPDEVARVGRAVADALDAAHRAGLLHRDVKPANILRTAYGEPKLADFGVARFADATATHGQLALTLAYAAPELLRGEPATVASDVYSLGATMHALLRGAPPFELPDGAAPMAVAVRIVTDDPPDLRAAGVPAALAAVVERAMAKEPAARYPSAAALRQALDALDEPPTTVSAATAVIDLREPAATAARSTAAPAAPAAPGHRRRPWWPIALVTAIALGVIAVAVGAATRDDDAPPADPGTTVPATAAPTTVPTTTAPPTTEAPTPTTEAPTPTTRAADPVDAARSYFEVLDAGDIDEGWRRLSSRYQQQSGRDAYYGFWRTIDAVEVLDARPGADELTAVVTLRYTRDDGSQATETNTLRFVVAEEGRLFVDGSE